MAAHLLWDILFMQKLEQNMKISRKQAVVPAV